MFMTKKYKKLKTLLDEAIASQKPEALYLSYVYDNIKFLLDCTQDVFIINKYIHDEITLASRHQYYAKQQGDTLIESWMSGKIKLLQSI